MQTMKGSNSQESIVSSSFDGGLHYCVQKCNVMALRFSTINHPLCGPVSTAFQHKIRKTTKRRTSIHKYIFPLLATCLRSSDDFATFHTERSSSNKETSALDGKGQKTIRQGKNRRRQDEQKTLHPSAPTPNLDGKWNKSPQVRRETVGVRLVGTNIKVPLARKFQGSVQSACQFVLKSDWDVEHGCKAADARVGSNKFTRLGSRRVKADALNTANTFNGSAAELVADFDAVRSHETPIGKENVLTGDFKRSIRRRRLNLEKGSRLLGIQVCKAKDARVIASFGLDVVSNAKVLKENLALVLNVYRVQA